MCQLPPRAPETAKSVSLRHPEARFASSRRVCFRACRRGFAEFLLVVAQRSAGFGFVGMGGMDYAIPCRTTEMLGSFCLHHVNEMLSRCIHPTMFELLFQSSLLLARVLTKNELCPRRASPPEPVVPFFATVACESPACEARVIAHLSGR